MSLKSLSAETSKFFARRQDPPCDEHPVLKKSRHPPKGPSALPASISHVAIGGIVGGVLGAVDGNPREVYACATGAALFTAGVEGLRHGVALRKPAMQALRKAQQYPVETSIAGLALVGLMANAVAEK